MGDYLPWPPQGLRKVVRSFALARREASEGHGILASHATQASTCSSTVENAAC